MGTLAYSRKKRQLKQLSEKLQTAMERKDLSADAFQKLIAKIRLLVNELKQVISARELKRALGAIAVFFGLSFTQNLSAQTFDPPLVNPFGLDSVSYYALPAFADLDGDGDLDLLVGEDYGSMQYFKNSGTASAPQFDAPVNNPFGINLSTSYYLKPVFADLDNDGDQDLLVGDFYPGDFRYLQNTGTATSPQFVAPVTNPFGLVSNGLLARPAIADLDNDGDLDILAGEVYGVMKYYENTGTATSPQFASPQSSPFNLGTTYYFADPAFADLDKDGDLDLLVGEFYGGLQYFENTGTASNPQFAMAQAQPFGLNSTFYESHPAFADLDSDGDMDLLVGEYSGSMQYFQNRMLNVSLEEEPAFSLGLYPNPSASFFEFESTEEIQRIELLDLTGRVLRIEDNPYGRISVEDLSAGTYLVKVTNTDGKTVNQKLQKL